MTAVALPSSRDLIRDYGTKTNLRCGCCGLTGTVWEVVGYRLPTPIITLCSWCDVEPALRWK